MPKIDRPDCFVAIDLALVLQRTGETERGQGTPRKAAKPMIRTIPRLGRVATVSSMCPIHALARRQGQGTRSAARSREGRVARQLWRYYRDFEPKLASIRNEPEFKAVFADIERDMAQQRAASLRVRRMRRSNSRPPARETERPAITRDPETASE